MTKNIQAFRPDELIPYARNAKKHAPEQVAAIAASIKEFGFNAPVLIAADKTIVAGHGRVLAAQKLGLKEVPCVVLDHLTETQRRAYVLADNRLGELGGGWDAEMLKLEVEDLGEALDGWGSLAWMRRCRKFWPIPTRLPSRPSSRSAFLVMFG
jgi:ParB-like chromosome segregation protein Spo0J